MLDDVLEKQRSAPVYLCASVIICAYTLDRWDDLNAAVASVRHQSPHEIIVVIDGNTALFERARREIAGVRVVLNTKTPGLSGGRMTGAEWGATIFAGLAITAAAYGRGRSVRSNF